MSHNYRTSGTRLTRTRVSQITPEAASGQTTVLHVYVHNPALRRIVSMKMLDTRITDSAGVSDWLSTPYLVNS